MINKLLNIDESKASIIEDHTVWTKKLYKGLTDLWRSESKRWSLKKRNLEEPEIRKRIKERGEMIVSDQKRIIRSLLNRHSNKIYLDKIEILENKVEKLFNTEEEIKEKEAAHFQMQYHKRKTKIEYMNKRQKEYYSLLEDVEESWYSKITSDIDEQEWQEALEKTRNNLVSGISGITCPLLKTSQKK